MAVITCWPVGWLSAGWCHIAAEDEVSQRVGHLRATSSGCRAVTLVR